MKGKCQKATDCRATHPAFGRDHRNHPSFFQFTRLLHGTSPSFLFFLRRALVAKGVFSLADCFTTTKNRRFIISNLHRFVKFFKSQASPQKGIRAAQKQTELKNLHLKRSKNSTKQKIPSLRSPLLFDSLNKKHPNELYTFHKLSHLLPAVPPKASSPPVGKCRTGKTACPLHRKITLQSACSP